MRRAAALACVVVVASFALAAGAPDPPRVTMTSLAVAIDDTSVAPVRLLYTIADGWRLTGVEVLDAGLPDRHDDAMLAAFGTPSVQADAVIGLPIDRALLPLPGDYQVVLKLAVRPVVKPPSAAPGSGSGSGTGSGSGSGNGSAAAAPPEPLYERVIITLKRKGPELAKPPVISIRLTNLFGAQLETITPLLLHEVSNRANLTGLKVTQADGTLHDTAPSTAKLRVTVGAPVVARGEQRDLTPWVDGHVPWGTTTGALEVTADQLDKPVSVTFSIDHRRWTGYIPLLFALGGFLGFWIRTWAKGVTEDLELSEDGDAAITAIDPLVKRSLPAEAKRLRDARAAILAASARDAATRRDAIDKATALIAEVVKLHASQLEARRALLVRYAAVPGHELTAQIGVELTGYREAIAGIEDALIDHDVGRAHRGLDDLGDRLEARRKPLEGWSRRLAQAIAQITRGLPRASTAMRGLWTGVTASAIRDPIAAHGPLLDVLEATDGPLRSLEATVDSADDELVALASLARQRLTRRPALAARLVDAIMLGDGDVPTRIAQIGAALAAWAAIFDEALVVPLATPNQAAAALAVNVARDAGDYTLALQGLDGLGDAALGGVLPVARDVVALRRAPRATAPVTVVAEVTAPSSGLVTRELQRKAGIVKVLQVIVAYAVLPFGAWVAWHETFIGLVPELIAIAATGFITDFTADAAVAKLQSLKK